MKPGIIFALIVCVLVLSACGPRPAATATAIPPGVTATSQPASPPTAEPATSVPPTSTTAPTAAAACTDLAAFVADVTVPDYSHLDLKEAFTKVWRVKNAGTCAWTSDYKAVYSSGDALGAPISIPLAATAPGATLDISADMVAPARDGKYEIFYQLTNASGDPMRVDAGDSIWALITVGKVVVLPPPTPTAGAAPSSGSTSSGPGITPASCVVQGNADFVSQTLTLINNARTANGLAALTLNDKLNTAAESHSADMACKDFLLHTGWNGSTPESRVASAGYAATIVRENIYGQPPQYGGTPQTAFDWWMGDAEHRAAILNPDVKDVGIGYAAYSRSTLGGYFTVDFAAP